MNNEWCYECFVKNKKPKGLFRKIYYYLWKSVGVSPSGVVAYIFFGSSKIRKIGTNKGKKK